MRAAKIDRNQPEIVAAHCPECGIPVGKDSKGRTKKFCSRTCVGKAVGRNGAARERGGRNQHKCANCEIEWESYYKVRKFCSQKCMGEFRTKNGFPQIAGVKISDEKKQRLAEATKEHMRRFGSRRDKNHPEIVKTFTDLGCTVIDLAELGNGCPDIAVYCRSAWHVIEIKNPETKYGKKGLSSRQIKWAAAANAPVYVIRSVDEAIAFVKDADAIPEALQAITKDEI